MNKKAFYIGLQSVIMAVFSASVQANSSMSAANLQSAAVAYENNQIAELEKLHSSGNPFATMMLARCLKVTNACDVATNLPKANALLEYYDMSDIMQVLLTLSMRGSQDATNWIANYYFDLNTPEGIQTAYKYFEKNASVGNGYAAYRIGDYHYEGIQPVTQDYTQAKNWYEKAAKAGHVKSMQKLAHMYKEGKGVSTDIAKSDYWQQETDTQIKKRETELIAKQGTRGLEASEKKNTIVTTYFGTNRNKKENNNPKKIFGDTLSKLSYGTVKVSIPKSHKIGEIESPFLWFKPDPSKHIMFPDDAVSVMNTDTFYNKLSQKIQKSPRNNALIFIHGFNTSFASAAKRTAQMSYDLKFDGAPIFYSWPASETILPSISNYERNEKNIEESVPQVTEFLTDVLQKTQAKNVYLIAHSMGNRALINSMLKMLNQNPELKDRITEVILAAPDVDANVFKKDIAPALTKHLNKPVTLYSSSNDIALMISTQINNAPRIGDAKYAGFISGIENVDVSNIDTSFIGHSYYGDNTSVISDIVCIIHKGIRAEKRNNLTERKLDKGQNWLFELVTKTVSDANIFPSINESCRVK